MQIGYEENRVEAQGPAPGLAVCEVAARGRFPSGDYGRDGRPRPSFSPPATPKARRTLRGSRTGAATVSPPREQPTNDLAADVAGGSDHCDGHRVSRGSVALKRRAVRDRRFHFPELGTEEAVQMIANALAEVGGDYPRSGEDPYLIHLATGVEREDLDEL